MKKHLLFLMLIFVSGIIFLTSCNNKKETLPCDNNGTVYVLNKLDTNLTVTITQSHKTYTVHKDENSEIVLTGNNAYTFQISSINYQKDTTFFVLPCDNILITVRQ